MEEPSGLRTYTLKFKFVKPPLCQNLIFELKKVSLNDQKIGIHLIFSLILSNAVHINLFSYTHYHSVFSSQSQLDFFLETKSILTPLKRDIQCEIVNLG